MWVCDSRGSVCFVDDDSRAAVVAAATAVEVGSKDALRRKLRDSKLIQIATDTNRMETLTKTLTDAVLGESYAAADKPNYDLVDALVKQRHALVHRGIAPDSEALRNQLAGVRAYLTWLDARTA